MGDVKRSSQVGWTHAKGHTARALFWTLGLAVQDHATPNAQDTAQTIRPTIIVPQSDANL